MSARPARLRILVTAGFVTLTAAPCCGQALQSAQVTWENDKWAFSDEDRSYTNGVRFEWRTTTPNNELFGWMKWLGHGLYGCQSTRPKYQCASGMAIGQNFYTPDNLDTDTLQVADRPYAGYLYGGALLTAASENVLLWTELDVGVLGDLSMAESTQKGVHKIVGATHPRGWSHQLNFEIAGAIRQHARFRVIDGWTTDFGKHSRWFDVVPHLEAALGTTFTHAEAGAQARVGYNITNSFLAKIAPVSMINTAVPSGGRSPYDPEWEIYGFISGEGRVAGRNAFLQGNLLSDSHSVDMRMVVSSWAWGAVVRIQGLSLGYQRIMRGREFTPGDRNHAYGSFAIAWQRSVCGC